MKRLFIGILLLFAFCNSVNAVTSITDNFSDGDYTANPTWTVTQGSFAVVANRLTDTAFPGNSQMQTSINETSVRDFNLYGIANATNTSSTAYLGIIKRNNGNFFAGGDFNGYAVLLSFSGANNLQLAKYDSGVKTVLYQTTKVVSTGTDYNIGLQRIGNSLSLYYNGTVQSSVNDFNHFDFNALALQWTPGATANKNDDINLFIPDSAPIFRIVDEESQAPLQATLTINNIPWYVSPLGVFDVNSQITFPATFDINMNNYTSRTFTFDSNEGLYEYEKIGLRNNTETRDIDFIFYGPDESTLITNQMIVVTKNGVVSSRGKTNSSGQVTFSLASQDADYNFLIKASGNDINTQYTYTSISVTVQQPKNEATNVSITPNSFNLDIGGLGIQNYSAQSLPLSTIVILGNTVDAYTLRIVDNNASGQQYYARNYLMQTTGDISSLTIQPYLIGINDGILVNLKVADLSTNQTIPNIRIKVYAGIGGSNAIVEDQITDSAGIAQIVMLSQKTYNLAITSINEDTNYFNGLQPLSASSQNFTIWINYFDNQITINEKNTTISIYPTSTAIINNPQRIDVNVDTNALHDYIYVQAFDSNTLVDQNNCSASPCHVSLTMNFNNFDTNFLNIKVIIQNNDFNFTRTISYYTAPFLNNVVSRVQNLKNEIGPVTLGVIMFAVIFGLIAFLGSNGLGNNMSQIFLIVITAGVFYFLWFYDVTKLFGGELFVDFLAGLFGVMLIYFWSRQKGGP